MEKQRIRFFIGMLIVGAIGILIYLALLGNTPQVYTDVVKDYVAINGENKSIERNLFYIFSFAGCAVYGIFYYFTKKNEKTGDITDGVAAEAKNDQQAKTDQYAKYALLALIISTASSALIYSKISLILIGALVLTVFVYNTERAHTIKADVLYFMSVYTVIAIYRLLVLFGIKASLSEIVIVPIAFIISVCVIFAETNDAKKRLSPDEDTTDKKKKLPENITERAILIEQVFIPFALLVYFASAYEYKGELMSVMIPVKDQMILFVLMAAFIGEAMLKLKDRWKEPGSFNKILTYGSCVTIMAFNRFSGTGSIISNDIHHPYEDIIGYFQVFELHRKLFTEYIPVSGMYSLLTGFLFKVFGNGQMTFFNLYQNMFGLIIVMIIVALLKKQVDAKVVFFITLYLSVLDYNRVAFMIPAILLLSMPGLIEKKNLWLNCWFMISFLYGLYYPLFGAAICLAFMPLGIWQIVTFIRSGKLKEDVKKPVFWIFWIICIIPAVLSIGLLKGTLKHMLAMSGQTIYADGLSRFAQVLPNKFFNWIPWEPIRMVIYLIFSFLIIISIVWLSFALFLRFTGKEKISQTKNSIEALLSISIAILVLVSISFTVVRMDVGSIYSRSEGVIYAVFIAIMLLCHRYLKNSRISFILFAFAVFTVSVTSGEGVLKVDKDEKLKSYYAVPDGYLRVVEGGDLIERWGEGFVEKDFYVDIESAYKSFVGYDKNDSYFGALTYFGAYYLCNVKATSVVECLTVKGYEAAKETAEIFSTDKPVVGSGLSALSNYYLYDWLMTSGKYIWDKDSGAFIYNDGYMTVEETKEYNKEAYVNNDDYKLDNVAGSWGESMNSLNEIFEKKDMECEVSSNGDERIISFDEIDGSDADFIYLEFVYMNKKYQSVATILYESLAKDEDIYGPLKSLLRKQYNPGTTVKLTWTDDSGKECSLTTNMDKGKLLVPLGSGYGWLLNRHSDLFVSVEKDGKRIAIPEISDICFLKIRDINI